MAGYALFWLCVLVLFEWLYGRHFRALVRALLVPETNDYDGNPVLNRLHELLAKLRQKMAKSV